MTKKEINVLVSFLVLMGLFWLVLGRLQSKQKLGAPGLRVVQEPLYNPTGTQVATQSVYLPAVVSQYQSKPAPVTEVELNWLPRDTTYGRRYYQATNGFEAMISVVLMGSDRTSIHKPEYCLTGQGWTIEKKELVAIPIAKPHSYDLQAMRFTAATQLQGKDGAPVAAKGIYVFWFVSEDQLTPDHLTRMWWMGRDLITSNTLKRWAYVAYFTTCWPGAEERTYQQLATFIGQTVPEFQLVSGPPKVAAFSPSAPASPFGLPGLAQVVIGTSHVVP